MLDFHKYISYSAFWYLFKVLCWYKSLVNLSFNTACFLNLTCYGYVIFFSSVYCFSSKFHFYFIVVIRYTRWLLGMSPSPLQLHAFQDLGIHLASTLTAIKLFILFASRFYLQLSPSLSFQHLYFGNVKIILASLGHTCFLSK